MEKTESDQTLLSKLGARERADLEILVDEFIAQEMPVATADALRLAGELFDDQSEGLPEGEALVGRQFAAVLRTRAAALEIGEKTRAIR